MRPGILALAAGLFCSMAVVFADNAGWVEAMANWFLPYVTLPLAMGLVLRGRHLVTATIAGASATVFLVVVFYGTNALVSPYPLSMWGPAFWALAGTVSGGGLGALGWWLRPRVTRGFWLCAGLAVAHLPAVRGPSLYSAGEILAASVLLVGFCWAIVLVAVRTEIS